MQRKIVSVIAFLTAFILPMFLLFFRIFILPELRKDSGAGGGNAESGQGRSTPADHP